MYFLLLIILLLLYFIFYGVEPLILNIIIMFVLTSGIFIDKRFNYKSRLIMIFILLLQFLVYFYLDLIPIILVKDLFWYALVLNISFIWYVLILHWLFEISLYYKWDYLCYLFSRLSLITSLTGLYWLFNWLNMLLFLTLTEYFTHRK